MLLVEDSATDVFVIREVLKGLGVNFRLDVAKDGQEALQYFAAGSCPALVLLDLNVPKVHGLEVLRQLRASEKRQKMPVIVISSSHTEEDRRMAEQYGANAYFQKPADLASYKELARVVERVMDQAGLHGNR